MVVLYSFLRGHTFHMMLFYAVMSSVVGAKMHYWSRRLKNMDDLGCKTIADFTCDW